MPAQPRPYRPTVSEQYRLAREMMKTEMPSEEASATIEPMGLGSEALNVLTDTIPNLFRKEPTYTAARTNPFTGNIVYQTGPQAQGQSTQQIADTLKHELTHRRQVLARTPAERRWKALREVNPFSVEGGTPYYQRPDEMEGFAAEVTRAANQGRSASVPSFWTGQSVPRGDEPLPGAAERARREAYMARLRK